MTSHSSHAVVPLALVAGTMVLTAAACGGGTGGGTSPTASGGPTVTATTIASATPTSAPSATPSATGGSGGGSDRCDALNLIIRYADDKGGGGAGSVTGTFTLTNRRSTSCTLHGFPRVSYVGGKQGPQVGQPATRTDDAVTTRTLAPGTTAKVSLRRTQPRSYGDECRRAKVTGFRFSLPDSTASGFVPFATTGCRSTNAPLLQVGPVH